MTLRSPATAPRDGRFRTAVIALLLASLSAFLVWNGIFGLHVSRGEKQYLIDEARHRLGEMPAPSVSVIMADTVRAGARDATRWAVVVFVLSLAASYTGQRRSRREADRRLDRAR